MYASGTCKNLCLAVLFAANIVGYAPASAQNATSQDRRDQQYRNTNGQFDSHTERLTQLAHAQADDAYREYENRGSNFRNATQLNMDKLYRTQAFSSNAELFQRMTRASHSENDLRQALNSLMKQSYSGGRSSEIRETLQNIQQSMRNVAHGGRPPRGGYGGRQGDSGILRWNGRVDDDVYIHIQNGTTRTQTLSGAPTIGERYTFTSALPQRPMTVSLNRTNGRGSVQVVQQPSINNDYTAIVRIQDRDGGAADYDFELAW